MESDQNCAAQLHLWLSGRTGLPASTSLIRSIDHPPRLVIGPVAAILTCRCSPILTRLCIFVKTLNLSGVGLQLFLRRPT
jgi:hypothetical protein